MITSVVAGGAGFIGSHLVDRLLSLGHRVYAIDNLITGDQKNLSDAKKNQHFTFIEHDVTNALPELGSIDYVYHLASPASVPDYQKFPEETALVNAAGTRTLLLVAKAHDAKFLFTSTSEVYGDPKEHPQKETYFGNVNPVGVRACYDESKRFGEMITMLYERKWGVDARIARIFNTYGPRMRPTDGRVVSNFITQALRGDDLTVYGDGNQTRSLCYVTDMVDGIVRLMQTDGTRGKVVNMGNPEEIRVTELAKLIKEMTGSSSDVSYRALPADDPTRRQPDIGLAKSLLQWEPKVSLRNGLALSIEHNKAYLP